MSEANATSAEDPRALRQALLLNAVSMNFMAVASVVNKFALQYVSAGQAAFLNSIFVVSLLLVRNGDVRRLRAFRLPILWVIGVSDALGVVLLYVSLDLISPVLVGFLGRLYTVFAILLGVVVLRERLTWTQWLIAVVALGGTVLFVDVSLVDSTSWLGVGAAVAYTLMFAVSNLLAKVASRSADPGTILVTNKVVSVVIVGLYVLLTDGMRGWVAHPTGVALVFLSAVLGNLLGLLFFYRGIRVMRFATINLIRSAGPLLTTLYAWPFFPVPITTSRIVGAVLLLGSVALLTISEHRSTRAIRSAKVEPVS